MKILMISKSGDGFGILQKLKAEGHEVRIWVKEKGFEYVCAGIIEQVGNWRPSASDWADLVISDMVGFGDLAPTLDNMGVAHMGFNQIADMMELDRAKQMQLFRKFSVQIPETREFAYPEQARSVVNEWEAPGYVIKPSGNLDTGKTYVIKDPKIFEWALEQYAGDQELVVQHIVEGVEVSTEGWFTGKGFLKPFNHTIEYKRFLPGNLGPNTGCMGNVVWHTKGDALTRNLEKLTPFLKAAGYVGPIDLNTIVNQSGIYALEVTARFGYDAVEALYETLRTKSLGEILNALVRKDYAYLPEGTLPVKMSGYGIAVRLCVPPYPFDKADKAARGMPIIGIPRSLDGVYPTDLYFNNGQFRWSASDGVVAKIGSYGKTIADARESVYSKIRRINTEGLMYRADIGEDAEGSINRLKAWGYL